jgi:hypothetical protein
MFDFSRITDAIADLIGGSNVAEVVQNSGAADLLQGAGIDPEMLSGLGETQIADLLVEHGIDPSQFDGGQLAELAGQFGLDGSSGNRET